jgi:hypothetical protein
MSERIRAAIRLLYPDEMTPTAKRVLEKILDEEDHEAAADVAAFVLPRRRVMSEPSIGQIVAAHLESDGDRYNLSNSLSIKVLATNLARELRAEGYGVEDES